MQKENFSDSCTKRPTNFLLTIMTAISCNRKYPFRTIFGLHFLLFLLTFGIGSLFNNVSVAQTIDNIDHEYDEELVIIPIRKDCSTVQPIATYSLRNGETDGVLYATACRNGYRLPSPLVDYVKYKFIDTGGSNPERCYGIVDASAPSGIRYSWEFLGAVPGYLCSKTNQTIHRMYPKGY